jgi:hypothetical protein
VFSFFHTSALSSSPSSSEVPPSRTEKNRGLSLSAHRSDSCLFVSQTATPENKHLRRHIRFAPSVQERQYALTLGDSPSCSGSYALSLGWEHTESKKVSYNDALLQKSRPVRQLSACERRRRLFDMLSRDALHLLELKHVSEQVESLQKELTELGTDSKMLTKWPKAIQP